MGAHIVDDSPAAFFRLPAGRFAVFHVIHLLVGVSLLRYNRAGKGVNAVNDGNKVRHNLALAYANNKLQIALQRGEHPQNLDLDDPAQAAHALSNWYSDCLEELINTDDNELFSPSSMD